MEREKEREIEGDRDRDREREGGGGFSAFPENRQTIIDARETSRERNYCPRLQIQ